MAEQRVPVNKGQLCRALYPLVLCYPSCGLTEETPADMVLRTLDTAKRSCNVATSSARSWHAGAPALCLTVFILCSRRRSAPEIAAPERHRARLSRHCGAHAVG